MSSILTIARFTVLESIRAQIVLGTAVLSLGLLLAAYLLRDLHFGDSLPQFLLDSLTGVNLVFGGILTITTVSQLFHRDIENRWILILLSRPVRHRDVVLGKYLGILATGGLFVALNGLLTALLLAVAETGDGQAAALPAIPAITLASFGGVAVLASASIAISALSTSLFTHIILSLLFGFSGLLGDAARELAETGDTSFTRVFGVIVSRIVPDLAAFFEAPLLLVSRAGRLVGPEPGLAPYAAAFVILYLTLAVILLRQREL